MKTHSPTSGRLQAFGSDSSKSSNFLVWSIVRNLQTQESLIRQATCGVVLLLLLRHTGPNSPFLTVGELGQGSGC